jgi:hypothetical protein
VTSRARARTDAVVWAKSRGGGSPLLRSGAVLPAGCGWCVQTLAKIIGHGGHTMDW